MRPIKKFDMHSRKPSLFLFGLGGRIFLCPLYVLKKFLSRSQRVHKVPNVFSRSSNSTTLLSHMFCPNLSSFDLHRWVKGEELYYILILWVWLFILRSLQSFSRFFLWWWWPNQNYSLHKEKVELRKHSPHLINWEMNKMNKLIIII
jgi:hypothetical protein